MVLTVGVMLLLAMSPRASYAGAAALPLLQSSTLDQANEPTRIIGGSTDNQGEYGQTFTAGRSGQLDRVELQAFQAWDNDGTKVPIQILAVDANGLPTGPALGSGLLDPSVLPTNFPAIWISVSIEPAVPVTAGVQYAIVRPTDGAYRFFWIFAGNDTYTAGVGVGLDPNEDFAFRTYVLSPNSAPVANDDSYSTSEDSQLTGDVLSNDTDVDHNALTAVKLSDPSNGTLTFNADGSFTYTPSANFFGTDSFTYKANDSSADSTVATVSITINAVNDAPSFTSGGNVTVAEDSGSYSAAWASALSTGPGNENNQSLVGFSVTTTSPALFSVQPAIASNGTLTFTPAANANGTASVTVRLQDNGGTDNGGVALSSPVSFTITVAAVDDAPIITVRGGQCLSETRAQGQLTLTITDVDSSGTLEASSSNTALVPTNGLLSGSGSSWALNIKATDKRNGAATITIKEQAMSMPLLVVTVWVGTGSNETLSGTSGTDVMFGLGGRNTLNGGDGNDLLCGGNGDDTLSGGGGNDTLSGARGSDTLNGNGGDDQLTGGQGGDRFDGGDGTDTITDFTTSQGDTRTNIP